jgi:Ser/Thr protein kinase RdoA (MazF antagonist)
VEPAALLPELRRAYRLPEPTACSFIRRGFNDTYLVGTPSEKYVFRLYFNRKYWIAGPDDFRFELELLRFVRERGVAVAAPIPRQDGQLLGSLETAEGTRYSALFAFADGAIQGPLTEVQAHTLGRLLAQVHAAADEFRPSRPELGRYDMDLRYLLDQPVEPLEVFLREHGRDGLGRYYPRFAELR